MVWGEEGKVGGWRLREMKCTYDGMLWCVVWYSVRCAVCSVVWYDGMICGMVCRSEGRLGVSGVRLTREGRKMRMKLVVGWG